MGDPGLRKNPSISQDGLEGRAGTNCHRPFIRLASLKSDSTTALDVCDVTVEVESLVCAPYVYLRCNKSFRVWTVPPVVHL